MNENKVIDLTARLPRRFERVPSDESWTELCKTAVIPALDICGRRLCNEGVKTEIQLIEPDAHHTSPFVLLTWEGKGRLRRIHLALHFTYLGNNQVGFTISALKAENGYNHQASLWKELFLIGENSTFEAMLHLASLGLGYARALDDIPKDTVWRRVGIPKDKMC